MALDCEGPEGVMWWALARPGKETLRFECGDEPLAAFLHPSLLHD